MVFELTEEQTEIMAAFLEDSKRDELIEEWLRDAGISQFKAKIATKVVLPAAGKLLGGIALCGAERLHESLQQHWSQYDKLVDWAGRWLLVQVETKYKEKKELEAHLPDQWKEFSEQTRVWITQLEQLNLIALSLGKLDSAVSLRIDEPGPLDAQQPSRLLRAYNAFIPLIGRDLELKNLKKFCEKNAIFAWHVMLGEGGIGKTRFALKLAEEYGQTGWIAGFISEECLHHFVSHDGFKSWVPLSDTLIIVDYAATKVESLKRLLSRCAELGGQPSYAQDGPRLRVLMLERHAHREGGWLSEILGFAEGKLRDEISDSLGVSELHAPGYQDPQQTMVEILNATMSSWEHISRKEAPQLPEFDEEALREITKSTEGKPLYLQMAGLHACRAGSASKLSHWGKSDLLKDAVDWEIRYIERQGERLDLDGEKKSLLTRAAALLCLTGPRSRYDAAWLTLLKDDSDGCGYSIEPGLISAALAEVLGEDAIAGEEKKICPIYPDLIGEAFAVFVLGKRQKLLMQNLHRVTEVGRAEAWSNLLRAAVDLYGSEGFEIVENWLEPLVMGKPRQELVLVESLLPQASVALARLSVEIEKSLLDSFPADSADDAERARVLNNLGNRYSYLGKRAEALEAAKRAVEIYERLAASNPDAFEPDLAMSYGALGNACRTFGEYEKSAKSFENGISTLKRLFTTYPDAYKPLMNALVDCYLKISKDIKITPSLSLLSDILEGLKSNETAD